MAEAGLPGSEALARLNALPEQEARSALTRCCGATRWVEQMLRGRPFASARALHEAAENIWALLAAEDMREAFAQHPEIGASVAELRRKFGATQDLSRAEQALVSEASEATLQALARGNASYRERFGYSFIVCATGKSAQEMLDILRSRIDHAPEVELTIAAAEQAKITRLRLEKIAS
jgi:2-oxo-4-hydroxy-4-carboxy-5-ureidoimidazoline decarboxylase